MPFLFYFYYILTSSLIRALNLYVRTNGLKRAQLGYFLWGSIIGFLGGSIDYLPKYGIFIYAVNTYCNLLIAIYVGIYAYAIYKYRLMDTRVIIKKGLMYSALIAMFTAVYIFLIYAAGQWLPLLIGQSQLIVSGTLICFFALIFQPLKEKIQEFIDKRFYKSKYDYQNMLKHLSQYAVSVIELDKLITLITTKVTAIMKLEQATIVIEAGELAKNRALAGLLTRRKGPVDREELAHRLEQGGGEELAAAIEEMEALGAALTVPLFFEGKLIGLFNLGNKLSQDMFTDEDLDLLTTLANQLAIAIENARLHQAQLDAQKQLLMADKLASLGRLAAGMAHEIKNPLAAIKGMTQSLDRNPGDAETLEDFKKVVPKEIDRLDGLVDGMIQLGRPPRLLFAPVKLNELIENTLKLFEQRCRSHRIEIVRMLGELPEIKADAQQLTQVLTNLVLNAIQAMPDGGKLTITTREEERTVILAVADTGRGIPPERLKDIFEPFFTTREEGLGLGLAITYQIIQSHHGSISVESQEGEGTKFRLSLPTSAG